MTIKEKLDILFNKQNVGIVTSEIAARGYMFPETQKKSVLFFGINPSYTQGAKNESVYGYQIEKAVIEYPRYYSKFSEIAKYAFVESDWSYMDMFFFRETNQKEVFELIQSKDGLSFICEQLKITQSVIEGIKPEIIVVCNSAARRFWGIEAEANQNIWLGYNFTFDETLGTDIITGMNSNSVVGENLATNLNGTPVLFASVLTYMDVSSKKRLGWHIKHILKNKPRHNLT